MSEPFTITGWVGCHPRHQDPRVSIMDEDEPLVIHRQRPLGNPETWLPVVVTIRLEER